MASVWPSRSIGSGKHFIGWVVAAMCAIALPNCAMASDDGGLKIEVGEPAGFASEVSEQSAVVDVYYGDRRVGTARIQARPGSINFINVYKLLDMLPELSDRAPVLNALASMQLPSNVNMRCSLGSNRSKCGRLTPDVAGVIYDRDNFRVDVFINPKFLAAHSNSPEKYLPMPQNGVAVINQVSALASGSFESGSSFFTIQDRLIVGDAEKRVRADLAYSNETGLRADQVALEIDKPEVRYSAGAIWSPGTSFTGRQKIVGVGAESQVDTRMDKDEIWGSPIIVFLNRRARIDILRDNLVLSSRIYEAGNQRLDTSALPEGTYDILIRIEESGSSVREEHRLYTKSRSVPAVGRSDFFAFGGFKIDDAATGSIAPSGHPFLQAGIAKRFGETFALDATLQLDDAAAVGELGANLFTPIARLRVAGVASSKGDYGAVVQVSSNGYSNVNFSFDLRQLSASENSPLLPRPNANVPYGPQDVGVSSIGDAGGGSITQVSGFASLSFSNVQLYISGYYRKTEAGSSYSFGPSARWDFLRRGPWRLAAVADASLTDQGQIGFVGLKLDFFGKHTTIASGTGLRSSDLSASGPTASIRASYNDLRLGQSGASIAAGIEHEPGLDSETFSTELRSSAFRAAGDLVHTERNAGSETQYALGASTTLAFRDGQLFVDGQSKTDSMVVVGVDGARPSDRFQVLVNDVAEGVVDGGKSLAISLPSYRAYSVRVRPVSEGLVAYDGSSRNVGLYPGSVTKLIWKANPVRVIFGQLVFPDGSPVAHASLTTRGGIGETDGNGYFQIEAPDEGELDVILADGRHFTKDFRVRDLSRSIASIGSITCCSKSDETRLSDLTIDVQGK